MDGLSLTVCVGNLLDVACTQFVLLPILDETFAGINYKHTFILAVFLEYHDKGRDTCTEEDVGREADDCIDVVFLDEVCTNLAFTLPLSPFLNRERTTFVIEEFWCLTPKEDSMGENDGENSIRLDMVKFVEKKSVISLGLRS